MSSLTLNSIENANQVYGFLCQSTNVFYAFESYETYAEFLLWLAAQEESETAKDEGFAFGLLPTTPSETEQLANAQLATD